MIRRVLDRLFDHEDLPFGRRWRLAGRHTNPWTIPGWIRFPWPFGGMVFLHHMVRADLDRDLHDHPWSFLSVILKGGYCEYVKRGDKIVPVFNRPGKAILRTAEHLHRVSYLPNGTAWTLVFTGPKRRKWGFQVGALWVDHVNYRKIQLRKSDPLASFIREGQSS